MMDGGKASTCYGPIVKTDLKTVGIGSPMSVHLLQILLGGYGAGAGLRAAYL